MIYKVEAVGINEPRKYIVYYNYGERRREFIDVDKLPKTVEKFIHNSGRKFALEYTTINNQLIPRTICYDND